MKKFLTLLSVLAITSISSISQASAESAFSEEQTQEIEKIITEYIKNNPAVIFDALENHRIAEASRIEEEARAKAADLSKELKENKDYPAAGNPDGDIIVAEFFDYNCGYCKKALGAVQKLTDKNENVKVVFIELPILGQPSRTAAEWALAAHKQGKYFELHQALMNHRGQKTENEIAKLAEAAGLDVEQLRKDAKSKEIEETLTANRALADSVGVSGTPAFIIENEIVRGYVPYETMEQIIAEVSDK